jgi:hypothetical protein
MKTANLAALAMALICGSVLFASTETNATSVNATAALLTSAKVAHAVDPVYQTPQERRIPTRDQIEELRRRASERMPHITDIKFRDCVRAGSTIEVLGRNFGDAPAGRALIIIRRVELATLTTSFWSNTRIVATVPARVAMRDGYDIAFKDAKGEWISNLKRVNGCAVEVGRLSITAPIGPTPENCIPIDLDTIDRVCDSAGCQIVQGSRVLLDYHGGSSGSSKWSDSQTAFELILSNWLTVRCVGPVNRPLVSPRDGSILRPARAVEYWLDASGRPPLAVTWACGDRPRSIDDLQIERVSTGTGWDIVRTEMVGPRRLTRGILYAFPAEADARRMLEIMRRHSGVASCSIGANDLNHRMEFFGR